MEIIRICNGGIWCHDKKTTVQVRLKNGAIEYFHFAEYMSLERIKALLPTLCIRDSYKQKRKGDR